MTRSIVLTEHDEYGPDPDLELHGPGGIHGMALASVRRALRKRRRLDVREYRNGLFIKTYAHVGRVRLGDVSVIIKPKLAENDFLALLSYVHDLDDLDLHDGTWFDASGAAIQELFIAQLQVRVREILKRGLARRYRPLAESSASPRGRLDFQRWATSGQLMSGRAPCIHHSRSADHLLNAVLLEGSTLARRLTKSPSRKAELCELEQRLAAEVRPIPLATALFRAARAQLNRLVVGYERPLDLIEMLHRCSGASWTDDPRIELNGFLFDMNAFFQKLLFRFLSAHLPDCEVKEEVPLHDLFRYSANPKKSNPPKPRPDFTVRSGEGTWLLDAKYRDLWRHGLPPHMLYQLSVYALSQGSGATVAILYPTESNAARDEVLQICAPGTGAALGRVALRPVLMSQLAAAVSAPTREAAKVLARALAFGGAERPLAAVPQCNRVATTTRRVGQ